MKRSGGSLAPTGAARYDGGPAELHGLTRRRPDPVTRDATTGRGGSRPQFSAWGRGPALGRRSSAAHGAT
jgi:hypothetical protein